MAADVEKLLIQIKADLKDLKNLQVELKNVKNKAKESADSASDAFKGFGGVIQSVGAAFVGSKIIGAFRSAIQEAANLENSLQKVASTARALKQSTAAAQKAAMDLASDGFMSASQSAQALSNLMQTGLSLDQAKKFVTASKDITAFGNTIGNAAQATEDLTAGLLKGSSLVIDNASPALKSLSRDYEKILNTQGRAKAAQFAYNAILKESVKFSGDAAKSMDTITGAQKRAQAASDGLSAAVGNALAPAYKGLLNVISSVTEWFTKLFTSLGSATQLTVLLVAAAVTIGVAFAALGVKFDTVAAQATRMWVAITGPIGLAVAAIGALAIAIAAIYDGVKNTEGQNLLEDKKSLEDKVKELEKAGKVTGDLVEARRKLKSTTDELNKTYGYFIKKLQMENSTFEDQLDLIRRIDLARRRLGGASEVAAMSDTAIERRIAETQRRNRQITSDVAPYANNPMMGDTVAYRMLSTQIQQGAEEEIVLLAELEERRNNRGNRRGGGGGSSRDTTEKRFNETVTALKDIAKELKVTKANINSTLSAEGYKKGTVSYDAELKRRIDQAEEFAVIAEDRARNSQRQIVAEYLEQQVEADRVALEQKYNDAIATSHEILNYELKEGKGVAEKIMKAKQDHAKRLADFEKQKALETSKIYAESFERTMNAANTIAQGVGGIVKAENAGGVLSGAGGVMSGLGALKEFSPALGALGPWGAAVGAAGGLVSTLTNLMSHADERAEEQRKRDEEAQKLLTLQADYQKTLVSLQESQQKTKFDNLQRDLRLIDINAQQQMLAGGDAAAVEKQRVEQRAAALKNLLSEEAGKIKTGVFNTDLKNEDPTELIRVIKRTAEQSPVVDAFNSIVNQSKNVVGMQYNPAYAYLNSLLPKITSFQGLVPDSIYNAGVGVWQGAWAAADEAVRRHAKSRDDLDIWDRMANKKSTNDPISAGMLGNATASSEKGLLWLLSEFRSDNTQAEGLLSVFEQLNQTNLQIQANTKATADNTAKQLDDRRTSFLDLGNRRVFSQGFSVDLDRLKIPDAASSVVLGSSIQLPALQNETVTQLKQLVELANEANEYLAVIAANTDGRAGTDSSGFDNFLISKLNQIKSRRVS